MVEIVKNVGLERLKKLEWHKIFNMFYIEPIVFALVFSMSLSGTIMKNQVIFQACTVVFDYNETDCKQLGTKNVSERLNKIESEVQQYVADLFMMRTLLESIVPAICGIFIGSWSDQYGRKPLLIIAMIGFSCTFIITAIICEISSYYPVNPWYYILAAMPHSFLGGNCVLMVAGFCFISDVTDTKTRPYRMIFIEVYIFIGFTTGALLSSYLYEATSATTVFSISAFFIISATLFVIFFIPESLDYKLDNDENEKDIENKTNDMQLCCDKAKSTCGNTKAIFTQNLGSTKKVENNEKPIQEEKPKGNKFSNIFSYQHIKDMINTSFKKRPCYDRCIIWLLTSVLFIGVFVGDGAMTVFYLFVREKFHWTVREFTFYETVSHMTPMFGALVGFLILRKVFKMSIVAVAIVSYVSDIAASFARGFASEPWHLYLATALGSFRSVGPPMCRTIVSNIVPATDLGKIFSIKNVLQSVAPFLAAPLYTFIYKQSLSSFPGLFNLVSVGFYGIALVCLIVVLRFKYTHKEHYAKILK
ncbi:solute carrier family 46 member 3-like isoform X1 [Teleopsis dalmanni]|uniref:solute carrier family 46 member 3-like isoform X1 n=2 Tax=Teleopsis dalmanni TaxID=139649 RepID=UPI0018CF3932|nr:solute carrier family 46 member 3-like isoform X1 [Teleopsis dalmanni]